MSTSRGSGGPASWSRLRGALTVDRTGLILCSSGVLVAVALTTFLVQLPSGRAQAAVLVGVIALAAGALIAARFGTATLAWVLFVGAVAAMPANSFRRGGVNASDVFLVAAVAVALLQPGLPRRPLVIPRRFAFGLHLFIVAGIIGSIAGQGTGLGDFARLIFTMSLAVGGMLWWRPDLDRVRSLAYAWLLGNTVSVGVALVTMPTLPPWARPEGLTTHPNALGLLCALSVAFTVFLHAASRRRSERAAALLFGVVAVAGMAVSGSRAAILAVAVVLFARVALGRSVVMAVTAAVGGFIGWVLLLRVADLLPENSAPNRLLHPGTSVQTSDVERIGRLRDSIVAVEQHPWFGSGFADATAAHSVFFQVAVAAGLVGAAAFVLACWPTLGALWRTGSGPWQWLGLLPLGYLTAAMASNNLWDRYVWFCLALGLLAATPGVRGDLGADARGGADGSRDTDGVRERAADDPLLVVQRAATRVG